MACQLFLTLKVRLAIEASLVKFRLEEGFSTYNLLSFSTKTYAPKQFWLIDLQGPFYIMYFLDFSSSSISKF